MLAVLQAFGAIKHQVEIHHFIHYVDVSAPTASRCQSRAAEGRDDDRQALQESSDGQRYRHRPPTAQTAADAPTSFPQEPTTRFPRSASSASSSASSSSASSSFVTPGPPGFNLKDRVPSVAEIFHRGDLRCFTPARPLPGVMARRSRVPADCDSGSSSGASSTSDEEGSGSDTPTPSSCPRPKRSRDHRRVGT